MTFQRKLLCTALLCCASVPAIAVVQAPQVVVTENTLYWAPVEALTINVHREEGGWLESIPGDATQWQAPAPGGYFIVAADRGEWQGWGKSNVVDVSEAGVNAGSTDDGLDESVVIDNYYAKVYSQTSAELFWELPNEDVVEVEILRADGLLVYSNGKSFYEGNLQPGTTYYYSLIPYDVHGNIGPEYTLSITTADATSLGIAEPATPMSTSASNPDSNLNPAVDALTPQGADGFNSRTDSWSIDGNTIIFAVDGWFQVQRAGWKSDYPTICEGVVSCTLEDNSIYQVVNHSTGEVWQNVRINPTSMVFDQIGLYGGQLYWRSVIYNHEVPSQYNVYLNGAFVESTSLTNTLVYDLARGTNHRATVYAVGADGTEVLAGDLTFVTDGPSSNVVSYGRPAADQNTFGFEYWDDIDEQNYINFPSDCLFALPVGGYCFSPSTRYLMEYNRYAAAGVPPIVWEFPLPGDNSTNHIEALAHFYGTGGRRFGAPRRFALVADVTTQFEQSRYEISVFEGTGSFLGTFPILEDIPFSAGDGQQRQINLDGADLRVTLGPVRPRADDASVYTSLPPRHLHIAGEYYEPTGSGSLSDLSGWSREGAFLAVVDANTGQTLEKTFYTGRTVEDVPID